MELELAPSGEQRAVCLTCREERHAAQMTYDSGVQSGSQRLMAIGRAKLEAFDVPVQHSKHQRRNTGRDQIKEQPQEAAKGDTMSGSETQKVVDQALAEIQRLKLENAKLREQRATASKAHDSKQALAQALRCEVDALGDIDLMDAIVGVDSRGNYVLRDGTTIDPESMPK